MLLLTSSMQAYFREALDAALRKANIHVTETAQVYVVHLLNEFCRSEAVFAGTDYGENISMALMFDRAMSADQQEALKIYRHVGDTSLYMLGFFRESALKRIVSHNYYKEMGAQAYLHASSLSRSHAINQSALFYELYERFNDMVIIVENVANYKKNTDSSQQ